MRRTAALAAAVVSIGSGAVDPGRASGSSHRESHTAWLLEAVRGPVSGLALAGERPGRIRLHLALADARQPLPVIENVSVMYTLGACGRHPGRSLDVPLRHVDGRGMEYDGFVDGAPGRPYITGRFRTLRAGLDRDGDGTFEETACAPVETLGSRAGWRLSGAELRPIGGGAISGIAIARERRGRLQMRLVLVDRTYFNVLITETAIPAADGGFARGACGGPVGRTFSFRLELDGFDVTANLRTPSRPITRPARSLRLAWDDGAMCGTQVTVHEWLQAS